MKIKSNKKIFYYLFRLVLFPAIVIYISSCSLKPFYSKENILTSSELSQIELEEIGSVYGSEYYDTLVKLLNPSGETKYLLITELKFDTSMAVLLPNADVIRERVFLTTNYKLVNKSNGSEITSGNFTRSLSYSSSFAPYPNTITNEDTSIILARSAAEGVRNRLILFFTNKL